MKHCLRILLLLTSLQANSVNIDSLFHSANKNYQNEKYTQAILNYNEILNNKIHSEELYFNLGNSYYKNGNVPASRLNFEKVLSLNPHNKDAQKNLSIVKERIKEIDQMPLIFFEKWQENFNELLNIKNWSILLIINVWLSIILLILFIEIKKHIYLKLLISSLILLIITVFSYQKRTKKENTVFGIIFTEENLKTKSKKNSSTIQIIPKGNKIEVIKSKKEWTLIKLQNGNEGWITNECYKNI